MPKKRHGVAQIIPKLRKADVELGKGKKVPEICKTLDISEQTYYRWRQKYGGMKPEMAKELKALQKENALLKKLVAEQALDMDILKFVVVWGFRKYQNAEPVEYSVKLAVRNVTSRGGRMTRLAYFARCGLWPGNGNGSEPSVFTICW